MIPGFRILRSRAATTPPSSDFTWAIQGFLDLIEAI